MRLLIAIAVSAVVLIATGCSASSSHPGAPPPPLPPDPHTTAALLTIARSFNHDYDTGDYAPVYARWDARSQAIITRADYIKRHAFGLVVGSTGRGRGRPGGPRR